MIDPTPRTLRLLQAYDDGEQARHFDFRIEAPQAADQAVIPGQFFLLAVPGFGEAPFTYVSPPDEQGRFTALVRRMGRLTTALFEMSAGAILGYRGPFGRGWPLFFSAQRVLAVAGGCGLAPLAGVIDEAAASKLPVQLSVIYGARHPAAQVLAREREQWRRHLPLLETFDQPGAGQQAGSPLDHLGAQFAEKNAPDTLLCCGPEPLMLATAEHCLQLGMAAERIWLSLERRMHCADGTCGHCYLGSSYVCRDGPTYRYDQYRALQAASGARLGAAPVRVC